MKSCLGVLIGLTTSAAFAAQGNLVERSMVSEVVYVESPTDTDGDGNQDLIYVSVERPSGVKNLSTLYSISPYALGGNDTPMHNVDMDLLPQDEGILGLLHNRGKSRRAFARFFRPHRTEMKLKAPRYAQLKAHSLGTGKSTGCPTVGDMSETLAASAVIDWLNGKARAFNDKGMEVKADWSNGKVGMTGVSYNGTLPIMVASTGVEGLKAIVPIAAISSWYDYYRAHGLVVNPGGYIGEDADVLGRYIVRKGACKSELDHLAKAMGREHGDFTTFWQERDYLPKAKDIKAATFIIHGQSDWNVKQKHAIQLWEAMESSTPKRMFLHRRGHSSTSEHGVPKKIQDWFDHFLEDVDNGITEGPQVEVELADGSLVTQENWPHEGTQLRRFYLSSGSALSAEVAGEEKLVFTDSGRSRKLESLLENPESHHEGRLAFLTAPFDHKTLLSGTTKVSLRVSVLNRRAANLTVALVEYDKGGSGKVITRGWADPQNHKDMAQGEALVPGEEYLVNFTLEPKQHRLSAGSRLGIVVIATDYDYTLRPKEGTKLQLTLGTESFVEVWTE